MDGGGLKTGLKMGFKRERGVNYGEDQKEQDEKGKRVWLKKGSEIFAMRDRERVGGSLQGRPKVGYSMSRGCLNNIW